MIGKLLGLAPWWVWLLAAGALMAFGAASGFGAATFVASVRVAKIERDHERERAGWEREKAKAAEIALDWEQQARAADEKARNTERTWLEAARSIDRDGQAQADKLRAAVARADAANVGLHAQLGAIVAEAARNAEASADSADARVSQATATAAVVYSKLLRIAYERGAERAAFADAARQAGLACQRWASELSR